LEIVELLEAGYQQQDRSRNSLVMRTCSSLVCRSAETPPRHFETIVLNAYRWLADNYEPGDRIFLFGEPYPHSNGMFDFIIIILSQVSHEAHIKFVPSQE